jgi:hypothetical protein
MNKTKASVNNPLTGKYYRDRSALRYFVPVCSLPFVQNPPLSFMRGASFPSRRNLPGAHRTEKSTRRDKPEKGRQRYEAA